MATTDKYDRQLRLWGANGQLALSSCHILLINATAVGTETLKNLVLPGIGSFHIVDDEIIQPYSNFGTHPRPFSNFFAVPDPNKPIPRAEIGCKLLLELNSDVKGSSEHVTSLQDIDYDSLLEKQLYAGNSDSKRPILVIASELSLRPLLNLAKSCWSKKVNLISVKSYGLIGTIRIQTCSHEVIEAKPDNEIPDLRLANFDPLFQELQNIVNNIDLASLDDMSHKHIPYVIILCKALEKWRLSKSPDTVRFPKTLQQKNEFKALIKSMARNFSDEENFIEAHKDAYLAYTKQEISFETMQVINESDNVDIKDLSSLTIMLQALKLFLKENNNEPPLNGSIPDMTSTTASYIALQKAYQSKANKDMILMRKNVDTLCSNLSYDKIISDEELTIFCKNIFNIEVLQTRSLADEIQCLMAATMEVTNETIFNTSHFSDEEINEDLKMTLMESCSVDMPLLWFIAIRACEIFECQHGMYPGRDPRKLALDSDVDAIHTFMKKIVQVMGLSDCQLIKDHIVEKKDIAKEVVRYFNAEVHNIGSIIGGVASQEAVKLITKQYIPMNNTFVFNGITATADTYQI